MKMNPRGVHGEPQQLMDYYTTDIASLYIKCGKVSVKYVRNGGRGQLSSE